MEKRIQASEHIRQALSALIEGRLSSPDARADLVKLATRLIVEEALEAESRDALGREYYEHGAKPGQGYRNGHRRGRLKTAEGFVEYAAPQVAGREEGFRSAIRDNLKGRTEGLEELAVELLARGLSVRDIEDTFTDENGRLLLSRTAVSELGERLWEDYQLFRALHNWYNLDMWLKAPEVIEKVIGRILHLPGVDKTKKANLDDWPAEHCDLK